MTQEAFEFFFLISILMWGTVAAAIYEVCRGIYKRRLHLKLDDIICPMVFISVEIILTMAIIGLFNAMMA